MGEDIAACGEGQGYGMDWLGDSEMLCMGRSRKNRF